MRNKIIGVGECRVCHQGKSLLKTHICPDCDMDRMIKKANNDAVQRITLILADVSEGTAEPERLEDIAKRAVAEAQSNVEGK